MFDIQQLVLDTEVARRAAHFFSKIFGPGRFARAAYRVRERGLSDACVDFFVYEARLQSNPHDTAGFVMMSPVVLGSFNDRTQQVCGYLLGPVGVLPELSGQGVGRALITRAVLDAFDRGAEFVCLVGNRSYYSRFGFEPFFGSRVDLGGAYDPARFLIRWREPQNMALWTACEADSLMLECCTT